MKCFICNGELLNFLKDPYYSCKKCGHRLRKKNKVNFMLNDNLDIKDIHNTNLLDCYKNYILKKVKKNNWLDIGSSSGKYLYNNKKNFKECSGIEVSPEAFFFSKKNLKLKIFKKISQLKFRPNLLTAWHSIEHFSKKDLIIFLSSVSKIVKKNTFFLISVPNSQSYQNKFFKKKFAYYDLLNHYHEFTINSLDHLLLKFNFEKRKIFYSYPYNLFGLQQGFLNLIFTQQNYFYYRFKRKSLRYNFYKDSINLFIFFMLIPISLFIMLLERLNLNKQAVLTILYVKKIKN